MHFRVQLRAVVLELDIVDKIMNAIDYRLGRLDILVSNLVVFISSPKSSLEN